MLIVIIELRDDKDVKEFTDYKPVLQDCPSAAATVLQTSHTQPEERTTHKFY
ncbi:MAG: hypothetical protein WCL42_03085 [Chlorobiaceae bacterium]|jgi:hypothetical protein